MTFSRAVPRFNIAFISLNLDSSGEFQSGADDRRGLPAVAPGEGLRTCFPCAISHETLANGVAIDVPRQGEATIFGDTQTGIFVFEADGKPAVAGLNLASSRSSKHPGIAVADFMSVSP